MDGCARLALAVLPLSATPRLAKALDESPADKGCKLPKAMAHFADIALWTHEGERVDFYNDLAKGKTFTVNFMYTHCQVSCSGITQNLRKVQRMLGNRVGKEIFMYSVTVDPENDTPAVLRKYVEDNEIGPGWLFLTGAMKDIERLRRALGLVDLDPYEDKRQNRHTGMMRIVNEPDFRFVGAPTLGAPSEMVRHINGVFPLEVRQINPTPGNFGRTTGPVEASKQVWPVGAEPVAFMKPPAAVRAASAPVSTNHRQPASH
jgi:protein SCO1/2